MALVRIPSSLLPGLACAFFVAVLGDAAPARAELHVAVVAADDVGPARASVAGKSLRWTSAAGVQLDLDFDPRPYAGDRFPDIEDWTPILPETVRDVLGRLRPLSGRTLEVRVYCLPAYPKGIGRSFCVGSEVFLAPAFRSPPEATVAYTLVHEIGHAVENTLLRSAAGWEAFAQLRGLDARHRPDAAAHRDRPEEIFAEDFRVLYGGRLARADGRQENNDLAPAATVEGLPDFFERVLDGEFLRATARLQFSASPNPFNPRTRLRVDVPPEIALRGGRARATIFDVRGRRVRRLPELPVGEQLQWDFEARDSHGLALASGAYTVVVEAGGERVVQRITLLK